LSLMTGFCNHHEDGVSTNNIDGTGVACGHNSCHVNGVGLGGGAHQGMGATGRLKKSIVGIREGRLDGLMVGIDVVGIATGIAAMGINKTGATVGGGIGAGTITK
jgi:hypothetical protein